MLTNIEELTSELDTIYFIIIETKKDKNNTGYLNKITVQHNDFDNIYNYMIQKFNNNIFAGYQVISINSYI